MNLTRISLNLIARVRRAIVQLDGPVRCRRAVAALEFALAAGPLLLMIFSFIAMNAVFYTLQSMQGAVQNAATLMATGQLTSFSGANVTCSSSLATTTVEYYACQNLPDWVTFTAYVTRNCTAPAMVTVLLTADAKSAALADTYSFFQGKTLSAKSMMMKQGSCP